MGTPQQFSLKWNNYSQHIVTAFEDLRGDDDLTDVTLSCEGKRIKAHKVLLSACSVYFKETFRENPCKHPVVILKGVSFADLQAVVTFMYNGQVNVSQERLNSFLQTAELLQIKGLTDMNDQEETTTKKRPHSASSGDPVITNVTHGKASSMDDTPVIIPEVVTTRPPTPKRKRIGPASFMQQQQLLSQQNDSQVPSSNSSSSNLGISTVVGASSSTTSTSAAGPSSVSSSTGGLLNPETVILPSMDSGSNSGENFSHGIIKFEEEELLDEDDDYEKNNLSEDNDNSMHDMLGSVEQDQSSLGSYIAGSSGQQPIKILSGGQDTAVHGVQVVATTSRKRPFQNEEDVDIGGGYYLKKSFVSYLLSSFTKSPAKFFRKIMFRGGLFTVEEIAKSSFSGFKSAKSGRTALDPEKLKAVIDFTVQQCNLQPRTCEYFEFEKKIKCVCCDARKALQKYGKGRNQNNKRDSDFTSEQCNLQPGTYDYLEFNQRIRGVCGDARRILNKSTNKGKSD